MNKQNDWFDSYTKKPEEFKVVHAITLVGKELDVVEAWWNGNNWVIPSVRSHMISTNVIAWKHKPKIPEDIRNKYENK